MQPIRVVPVANGPVTSVEPGVPARRRHARHRARRPPAHHPQRRARSDADRRRARRLRARARRTARRGAPPEVRREPPRVSHLLEGPRRQALDHGAGARPLRRHGARPTSRRSSSPTPGASRTPTTAAASPSIAPGFLYLTVGERQEQDRAQKRRATTAARCCACATTAPCRPTIRSSGTRRLPAGDLLARSSQPAGSGDESRRPARSGRTSMVRSAATSSTSLLPGRNYGWPLVTFGTDYDGTKISDATWRADLEVAVHVLGAVDCDLRPDLLHRRSLSAVEGQRRSSARCSRAAPAAPVTSSASSSTPPGSRSSGSRCSPSCTSAFATSRQGPDGLLYLLTDEDAGAWCSTARSRRAAARAAAERRGRGDGPPALPGARRRGEPEVLDRARRRSRCARARSRFSRGPGRAILKFQDVLVVLEPGEHDRRHRGLRRQPRGVPRAVARPPVEAAGLKVARLQRFPGVGVGDDARGRAHRAVRERGDQPDLHAGRRLRRRGGARGTTGRWPRRSRSTTSTSIVPDAAAWPRPRPGTRKVFGGIPGKRSQLRRRRSARHQPELFAAPRRPAVPDARAGCSTTSGSRCAASRRSARGCEGHGCYAFDAPCRGAPSGLGTRVADRSVGHVHRVDRRTRQAYESWGDDREDIERMLFIRLGGR